MFNRIRNYIEARRVKKKIDSTLTWMPIAKAPHSSSSFHIYKKVPKENALTFTGNNGEEIFSISSYGEARWYKEDAYNEAAEMFLTHLTMNIEDAAGIRQNRLEWEERITAAIASEAEAAPR